MPMKNPPHPGKVVRVSCLEPLGLSVTDVRQGAGREPPGAIEPGEREGAGVERDGDTPRQGIRLHDGDLDTPPVGLRHRAGASSAKMKSRWNATSGSRRERSRFREKRSGQFRPLKEGLRIP